jgi:hypothetical protein
VSRYAEQGSRVPATATGGEGGHRRWKPASEISLPAAFQAFRTILKSTGVNMASTRGSATRNDYR